MSLYAIDVTVTGPVTVVEVAQDLVPARLQCWLDPDAICAILQQAFAQELSVAYIEAWLARYKAGEIDAACGE